MPDNDATRLVVGRLFTYAAQARRKVGLPVDHRGHQLIELAERLEDYAYQLLQERSGSTSTYRVYFRSKAGIRGRHDFSVADDETALTIAALLADACSDECASFEVWQGTRRVGGDQAFASQPRSSLEELTERQQALTIECEEAIRDSYFAIASSRRLLKRLNGLR